MCFPLHFVYQVLIRGKGSSVAVFMLMWSEWFPLVRPPQNVQSNFQVETSHDNFVWEWERPEQGRSADVGWLGSQPTRVSALRGGLVVSIFCHVIFWRKIQIIMVSLPLQWFWTQVLWGIRDTVTWTHGIHSRVHSVWVTEYFVYKCSGSNSFEKQFFVIDIS